MPEPYYSEPGIVLYHGDAREILPQLDVAVESVVTDPVWPAAPTADRPRLAAKRLISGMAGLEDPQGLWNAVLPDLCRLSRRLVVILGSLSDPRFLRTIPPDWRFVCMRYLRYALPTYRGNLVYGGDLAYIFGEWPKLRPGEVCLPGEFTHRHTGKWPQGNGTGHPAARQITHMRWLVRWFGGASVLDPFAGSGTTLRAAKDLGVPAVGIEIEERWCELAAKRMAQGVLL